MSPQDFAKTITNAIAKRQVFNCKLNVVKSADPNRKLGPFAQGQSCEFVSRPMQGETLQFLGAKFLVLSVTHVYGISANNEPETYLLLEVEELTALSEEEVEAEAKRVLRRMLTRGLGDLPPELEALFK